ncbi:hypothetical protein Ancab_007311 [Ancistrocladus abbreviatus]
MDTLLVEGYTESMNVFKFGPESFPPFLSHQIYSSELSYLDEYEKHCYVDPHVSPHNPNHSSDPTLSSGVSSDGESPEVPDFSDACLKYMSEILMEEDLEGGPATLEEYDALKATEKELYDVLGETNPAPSNQLPAFVDQSVASSDCASNRSCSSYRSNSSVTSENVVESNWMPSQSPFEPFSFAENPSYSLVSNFNSHSFASRNSLDNAVTRLVDSSVGACVVTEATSEVNYDWLREAFEYIPNLNCKCTSRDKGCPECSRGNGILTEIEKRVNSVIELTGRKNHRRDDIDYQYGRSNKHLAAYDEDNVSMEQFDDVFLCKGGKDDTSVSVNGSFTNETSSNSVQNGNSKRSRGKATRGKKQSSNSNEELVDLTTLLTHCAQAVASFDIRTANDRLKQIRQHSSPKGSSIQRLSHYFANALEARLAGNGAELSADFLEKRSSLSDILKAYRVYASATPFKRTSYFLANQSIAKLAETAKKIHIIDFGIFYGFQWPCFIQKLSKRPNGPPKLRITGIDFPVCGFRPARVVEETGRRLAGYCDRFNVPFEYHAIAQKWDTIQPEDLKIDGDEVVVVNCMCRAKRLLDETVDANSPRDAFLRLVRKLNPDMFIQGIVNGSFNAPFFITRFREALFYYSAGFDLFEATIHGENQERLLIEKEFYGKDILNVLACEGAERIERPETYKQWQVRMQRAGFRVLPLNQELLKEAKDKVKANYHKDFLVGEDNQWMLQGWKGKILFALSCWKPV